MNKVTRSLVATLTLVATLAATLVTASPTLAVTQPTFSFTLGRCIGGALPQASSTVDIVWRDKAGQKKAKFSLVASNLGYWTAPAGVCATHSVVKGDTIRAHITQPSEMTRTFTVRGLIGSFDRTSNVVGGTAPAAGTFSVTISGPDLATDSFHGICAHVIAIPASGNFTWDSTGCQTGYDAIGGDIAYLTWFSPAGDREIREIRAAFVDAVLNSSKVDGYLTPNTGVSLRLVSQTGTIRGIASGVSDFFGKFTAHFKKSGQPVITHAGNVVSGNWVASGSNKVQALTTHWDLGANTVWGTCTPNTAFGIHVEWSGASAYLNGTTDGTGAGGVLDLNSGSHQLVTGDQITLVCMRPNGDRTQRVDLVPA